MNESTTRRQYPFATRLAHWATLAGITASGCVSFTAAQAQTVIGSAGAGFQHWQVANLNNNNAPFWDSPYTYFNQIAPPPAQTSKNAGFCLTSTGDCQGVDSGAHAPGAIDFWGMPYDSSTDAGGGFDPSVYLKRAGHHALQARLSLNFSSYGSGSINEFGWFETDAAGSKIGATHVLFKGSAPGPADPIGKTVSFTPTEYFGFYFGDVSELSCKAYTLSAFNDPKCGPDPSPGLPHNLVIFSENSADKNAALWVAAEDPPGCGDGDCNLSLVRIGRESEDHDHH